MTQKKEKTNRQLWIIAKSSHFGETGAFVAGQTYQVYEDTLRAINKEIDAHRKSLPKQQRSAIKDFQYAETVAPWDANKDMDRIQLAEAQDTLNTQQANLNSLRSCQNKLINQKASLENALARFDDDIPDDIKDDDTAVDCYRRIKQAQLAQCQAELGLTVCEISKLVKSTNETAWQIDDLRKIIADKESAESTSEETDHDDAQAKTETGSDEPAKDDEDTQGQAAKAD